MQRKIIPAGTVEWARFTQIPPRFTNSNSNSKVSKVRFTKQQKEGLRYERKAIEYLQMLVNSQAEGGDNFFRLIPSPWIMFRSRSEGFRYCQPDVLLIDDGNKIVIIVEIKYQHTSEAWRQVRLLYEPVVRAIEEFKDFSIRALEVSKWLDPHSAFPEQYYYAENVLECKESVFGIHLYKPSREKRKRSEKGKSS